MGQPGFGVMINALFGSPGAKDAADYIGRRITAAELTEEHLRLTFEDGKRIEIFDNGQSCCESRYMRTDDDVQSLVGHNLRMIEAKEAPNEPDEYGEHEVIFLEVGTDQGFVTIANHNEHNGYYGGFSLTIRELD